MHWGGTVAAGFLLTCARALDRIVAVGCTDLFFFPWGELLRHGLGRLFLFEKHVLAVLEFCVGYSAHGSGHMRRGVCDEWILQL